MMQPFRAIAIEPGGHASTDDVAKINKITEIQRETAIYLHETPAIPPSPMTRGIAGVLSRQRQGANIGSQAGRRIGSSCAILRIFSGTYFVSTTRRNMYSSNQRSDMMRCP